MKVYLIGIFMSFLNNYYIHISGYRMAAEAARKALLEKVMDNKQDAGN